MEKEMSMDLGFDKKKKKEPEENTLTKLSSPSYLEKKDSVQTTTTPYAAGVQTGLYSQPKKEETEETPDYSPEKETAPDDTSYSFITGLQPGEWQSGSGVESSFGGEETERPEGYRDPTLGDLTIGSFQKGYDTARYGQESFRDMWGDEDNRKEEYEEKLTGEKYKFMPNEWWEKGISDVSSWLGGEAYKAWKPETLAAMGEAAGAAAVAGKLGPQALLPEEGVTIPGAVIAAYQAKSVVDEVEIQAGLAYNRMRESDVPEEVARVIAMAIGGVDGAIDVLPMDSVIESVKILDKSGVSEEAIRLFKDAAEKAGMDIGPVIETILKARAQEGVSNAGVEIGTRLEEGVQPSAQEKRENVGIDGEENPWVSDDTAKQLLGNQSMLDYLAHWGDLKLTKGMKLEEKISAVKKAIEVAIERQKGIPSQ